ncbi:MAG: DUF1538 domain-containing protein [Firmicutes bacterium]|nr:DUF1538 domain-containing protein [Bacillota bacterium]
MRNSLREKLLESLSSVLPITVIIIVFSISLTPLGTGIMTLFVFGSMMLIAGIGLFTLGSDMSMMPLGEGVGIYLNRFRKIFVPLIVCFVLGVLITTAEPDLRVLANQIPSISDQILIWSVAFGVGVFLVLALLRIRFKLSLSKLLIVFYGLIMIASLFAPEDFIPAAFDSGGVTTGPMTVPFLMAMGSGLAVSRSSEKDGESGFGLVALCSIGPILSVIILSICFRPEASTSEFVLQNVANTRDAFIVFLYAFPGYLEEVALAIAPLVAVFIVFQIVTKRFHRRQMIRITIGILYTYIGLVLFLTGANVGFMPAGQLIGRELANGQITPTWIIIPAGMVIGYFVVAAEPAVHVLKRQVEDVTSGAISGNSIRIGLSVGVALAIGIAMLRILTGIRLLPFMIVGYLVSLGISFFVPKVYTGVAFDAGGVASGPMTTTFILPFAIGACETLGGNLLTDAFGIVAMVALTPLITIQIIGLYSRIRSKLRHKQAAQELDLIEDEIVYYYDEAYLITEFPEDLPERKEVGEHA